MSITSSGAKAFKGRFSPTAVSVSINAHNYVTIKFVKTYIKCKESSILRSQELRHILFCILGPAIVESWRPQ